MFGPGGQQEALTHFALVLSHGQGDVTDQFVVDAACMCLCAGMETSNRLDAPSATSIRQQLVADVGHEQSKR